MNLIALGIALLGLTAYAYTMRRVRTSPVDNDTTVEGKLAAAFLLFAALSLLGLNYGPVERGESSPMSTTPAVLCASVLLAVPQCFLLGFALRRAAYSQPKRLAFFSSLLLAIFNGGVILLANGALDFAPSQRHTVMLVEKRFYPGGNKAAPAYLLLVNDWNGPNRVVRLQTTKSRFERAVEGNRVELEAGPGLLGIEWVRRVHLQPASRKGDGTS